MQLKFSHNNLQLDRVKWLDTWRVLASFLVLLSHYAYWFEFDRLNFVYNFLAGTPGRIRVSLFFCISGYLAAYSLQKNIYIFKFYKKKAIRILTPYWATYFFLSFLFIVLATFNHEFLKLTPLSQVIFVGGDYTKLLLALIPVEANIQNTYGISIYHFVGE